MNIVCLGDSITDCQRLFAHAPLGNGYVSLTSTLAKSNGYSWNFYNKGVDGFTITRLLTNLSNHSFSFSPDTITLLIGINDLALMKNTRRSEAQQQIMMNQFLEKYEQLLQLLLASCPTVLAMEPFLFPWPAEYLNWYPLLSDMQKGIQKLSQKYHLPFLSLQKVLEQKASQFGTEVLTTDGVHLTMYGHEILSSHLYLALENIFFSDRSF